MERNYREIVLTGGPCSGKTTAKSWLTRYFGEQGIRVLQPDEIATQVISSGLDDFMTRDDSVFQAVESTILDLHLTTRNSYRKIAEAFAPEPVLIVYDRAEGDLRSYVGDDYWDCLAKKHGLDGGFQSYSYDTVIHLVSAATGAEEHYTLENNSARRESIEEAALRDKRTLECWLGHPNLKIIDNSTDFAGKMERLIDQVKPLFLIDEPSSYRRLYLLGSPPNIADLPAPVVSIKIKETLTNDQPPAWLTSWDCAGQIAYFLDRDKGGIATASIISPHEYDALADSDENVRRRQIDRQRWCFHHNGRLCRIDLIEPFSEWVLSVDLESETELFVPPENMLLSEFDESHLYTRAI